VREVADFEEAVVGLDVLAFVDVARDDSAGNGRAEGVGGAGLEGFFESGDVIGFEAEEHEAFAGFGAVGVGEGNGGAEAFGVLALRGEHVGAVERGEGGAGLDVGTDGVDVEFFDAPGDARAEDAVRGFVVVENTGDAEGARERAAGDGGGFDTDDGGGGRWKCDEAGTGRAGCGETGVAFIDGHQVHAADGAFAGFVGFYPRVHRRLVEFDFALGGRGGGCGSGGGGGRGGVARDEKAGGSGDEGGEDDERGCFGGGGHAEEIECQKCLAQLCHARLAEREEAAVRALFLRGGVEDGEVFGGVFFKYRHAHFASEEHGAVGLAGLLVGVGIRGAHLAEFTAGNDAGFQGIVCGDVGGGGVHGSGAAAGHG